jgi:hypothetical protein
LTITAVPFARRRAMIARGERLASRIGSPSLESLNDE